MDQRTRDSDLPSIEELLRQEARESYRSWLQPKPGDLLGDAKYFLHRATAANQAATRARYARASLLLSAGAVEAITNDALATIHFLLSNVIPWECRDKAPWVHFRRVSTAPLKQLLNRGRLPRKTKYLLGRVERATGGTLDDETQAGLRRLAQARNRIVHMTFLWKPSKYPSVLNDRQVLHVAKVGYDTARAYIDFLDSEFSEMNLPIETVRPEWWGDDSAQ